MIEGAPMSDTDGICLRFYVAERRRHHGVLLYEWLLERARKLDLRGGSAFRAIAGFGRDHRLHEQHFFELAGDTPIEVVFFVTAEEESRLLHLIEAEELALFFVRHRVEFGVVNGKRAAGV
jgi:PII-like signaling protein